jgi:raffinose/stachyose/melibiose transport system permease protein
MTETKVINVPRSRTEPQKEAERAKTAKRKKRPSLTLGKFGGYAVFILFTFLTVYPLFWLGYSSLKTNAEIQKSPLALPAAPQIDNYINAWQIADLGRSAMNSVIYTGVSTTLVLISAMMASYAFAKTRFVWTSRILFAMIALGLLISTHSILIPLFLFLRSIGLTNSRMGVILAYSAVNLPLAVFLGTEFIRGMPDSLMESARMDGASNFRIFRSIILPMTQPVMVTAGIMTGLACWNEFLLSFVLTGPMTRSLPVQVFAFANPRVPQYHLQFAALMISILPILITYAAFNRRITRGVVAGALKG